MPLQKLPEYGAQGTLPSEADSRRAGWASRRTAAVHGDRVAGADCPPQSEGVVDVLVGHVAGLGHGNCLMFWIAVADRRRAPTMTRSPHAHFAGPSDHRGHD